MPFFNPFDPTKQSSPHMRRDLAPLPIWNPTGATSVRCEKPDLACKPACIMSAGLIALPTLHASYVHGKQLFNTNAQPESSLRRSVSPKGSRQRTSSRKLRLPIAKASRMCIR